MIRVAIKPTELFDREALQKALGLRPSTLSREIRQGRLKVYSRGKRHWFIGSEVLSWIRSGEVKRHCEPA